MKHGLFFLFFFLIGINTHAQTVIPVPEQINPFPEPEKPPKTVDPSHRSDKPGRGFIFYLENDSRNIGGPGSDQSYSNGFKFSYIYAEDKVPTWAQPTIDWSDRLEAELKKSRTNFGVSLGQQIFTPNNTDLATLIPDDRPYAAWLHVGFMAQFKTDTHNHAIELDLGVIGPEALGKEVQNNFHRFIGVPENQGWANQLQTEPTVQLNYQQRLRFLEFRSDERKYMDIIPYFGGALGNVLIAAHAGGMVRGGYNIPSDFGPTRPSAGGGDNFVAPPSPGIDAKYSFYGFAGMKGNAIGRNIFLDGNTFHSSHHVTKYPFTMDTEFGFAAQLGRFGAVWRFVTLSPEFEQKSVFNSFASISLTYTSSF